MCGILGYIDPALGPKVLDLLLDTIQHRGPDGVGRFDDGDLHIGMRRLSVIDLSTGWQPLVSREGRVVVFQNGEVYNYKTLWRELEAEGYQFKTKSDTEVLAIGYDAWGIDGLMQRIDAMFAVAIYDADTRMLHLARDRMGEKPFFYAHNAGRFAFSSSMVPLAALPWVEGEIDPLGMDRYLAMHFVPGDRTILTDIHRILPGERLEVPIDNPDQFKRLRYWKPSLNAPIPMTTEALEQRLEAATVSRLVADVPVGVFLSGGLDSSLIAAMAAKHSSGIATFSMGFDDPSADESGHAATVAKHVGSTHHHFNFDRNSFNDLLPKVADGLDEPIGDQAALPLYWLCGESRKLVTVALSGEGADEIFGGYNYYRQFAGNSGGMFSRLGAWLRGEAASPRHDAIFSDTTLETVAGFPLLSNATTRIQLTGHPTPESDPWETDVLDWLNASNDRGQQAGAADIATWLVDDLLVKFDRMSMAHSLEGRAPYLAPDVVNCGLALPANQRVTAHDNKMALKAVARNWLPDEIIDRPKHGFVLPMRGWLADWFDQAGGAGAYLRAGDIPGLAFEPTERLIADDLAVGVQRDRLLMALVMLIEWWRSFSDRRARLSQAINAVSNKAA